jgi:hypothetical protein
MRIKGLLKRLDTEFKREVLQNFINEIGISGRGSFAEVLADLAAIYLLEGHLPPAGTWLLQSNEGDGHLHPGWSPFPFNEGDVHNELI